MPVSAVRGATTSPANTKEAIHGAVEELIRQLSAANGLVPDEIVAAFFTMTPDLDAAFPAYAARRLGWDAVPLLGAVETPVPGFPPAMIRVLVLVEREKRERLKPVYLNGTERLRPDLFEGASP